MDVFRRALAVTMEQRLLISLAEKAEKEGRLSQFRAACERACRGEGSIGEAKEKKTKGKRREAEEKERERERRERRRRWWGRMVDTKEKEAR